MLNPAQTAGSRFMVLGFEAASVIFYTLHGH
jgi:hypothetical protein